MTVSEISRLFFTDGWLQALAQGMVKTLGISLGAFVLGLSIGLIVAMVKLKGPRWMVVCANCYTTLYRAVPELLLILLLYYAGADLINLTMAALGQPSVEINGFMAAVVVLGIVQGAYSGEIIRGAIESIPHGQIEAARSYGINRLMLVRRVILPSMLPFAIAGLSNLWLVLVKESALISVVGYSELLTAGRQAAASTKHYLLFYLAVAAFYYLITLVSSSVFRQVEVRFERWMPRHS
ncbi:MULTISPECIES: ABC transporter permease [Pseudomonas]|jgi:polar amino acid transport system permease protein|uniref:ABC transporter permease subunit n=1 Tax=Pseudomonas kielensis TaxID=2762577 RepID=A0A7X1GFY6_9PSED|nr:MULTISPECIES: ABC transporter permease subunit [Pseudomonas]MBC2691626.1 ABC transporter permease subunit [Pseudomonas kielensis]NBB36348.1 ABC transporter permease subunit [Pseudomonas sp. BC115LW]WKL53681.1 ABC transporter permease subunit [Pseudomonas kielensis]